MTFPSLEQALHAGFLVCKRTERGYRVATRTAAGWLEADVDVPVAQRKADENAEPSLKDPERVDHRKSDGIQEKR
jgi:hypothetical protein